MATAQGPPKALPGDTRECDSLHNKQVKAGARIRDAQARTSALGISSDAITSLRIYYLAWRAKNCQRASGNVPEEPQRGTARGQPGRHVDPCPYVCMAQKENDMTTVALKHAPEQAELDHRLDVIKLAPRGS